MRLIDADARVTVQSFDIEHEEYEHTEMSVEEALDFATDEGCPPAVDAVPVTHGRWIEPVPGDGFPYCSNCKNIPLDRGLFWNRTLMDWHLTPYCPHCGAKMDGDEHVD